MRFGFFGKWLPGLGFDQYIEDLAGGILPLLMTRLKNVQTFRLQTPSFEEFGSREQLMPDMLSKLTNSFVHTLRFVSVSRLRCLHLSLPTTAEFARYFETYRHSKSFADVVAEIKELHITINDSTGSSRRTPDFPPPSLDQTDPPIGQFTPYLVLLISHAKQIQFLSLNAYSWLNLSDLETGSFSQLKRLRLEGVQVKHDTLRQLFVEARITLLRVELVEIELLTGNWDEVFDFCRYPDLLPPLNLNWLNIYGCGYSKTGASAKYASRGHSEVLAALWSSRGQDWMGLIKWMMATNINREAQGLPQCPHTYFPYPPMITIDL